MSFASDTFTGTNNTELSTYSAVWSKQTGYSQDAHIGINGQYACNFADADAVYQHSGSPVSADYSVFADFARGSGAPSGIGPRLGLIGRAASGAQTFYWLLYSHDVTNMRLFRMVAGSQTQLGSSYTYTLTTTPVNVELRMSGSDISVHLDGGAAVISATDGSPITAAGKAGIYLRTMRESGIADSALLDNFDAVDAGGGGSSTTPPPFPRFNYAILNH